MLTGPVANTLVSLLVSQADVPPANPARAEQLKQELSQFRAESADVAAWTAKMATEWSLRVVGVLLVLMGAWMVAAWARKNVYKALNRPQFDQTLVRFLSNLVRYAILVLGLVASLTIFGIAPASLAAVVGATGLAIGLAIQGSLSNLAAGIMLLLLRPFNVGDVINVAGQSGKVDDIELFTTKIDTPDNRRVVVPNGQIFGAVIENATHHATRRVDIPIGVEYSADIDATRQALLRAVGSVPAVLPEPAPAVVLMGLGSSSVDWQVQLWVATTDFGTVRQTTIRAIKVALDEAGISIPFPQLEVWNRGQPPAQVRLTDQAQSRLASPPPDWPRVGKAAPDPE
jgi:small conductance mechanosensitive channel